MNNIDLLKEVISQEPLYLRTAFAMNNVNSIRYMGGVFYATRIITQDDGFDYVSGQYPLDMRDDMNITMVNAIAKEVADTVRYETDGKWEYTFVDSDWLTFDLLTLAEIEY